LLANDTVVRALARNPDACQLPSQVEVVRGDLTRPDTLDSCLSGADTVFLVWTAPAESVVNALERITRQARRIVFLSAPLKTPHPLFQQPNAGRALAEQIERLIEASGVHWTFLRPGMFAANALRWWMPQIRAGDVVRWPYLSVPTAPIDERDIATVVVRALREDGHRGAEYVLTGPESLTHLEQLTTIARVIGRPLRIEELSPAEAPQALRSILPPPVLTMLMNAWAAAIGHPAVVTSTFTDIAGRPARSFATWVADHAAQFAA